MPCARYAPHPLSTSPPVHTTALLVPSPELVQLAVIPAAVCTLPMCPGCHGVSYSVLVYVDPGCLQRSSRPSAKQMVCHVCVHEMGMILQAEPSRRQTSRLRLKRRLPLRLLVSGPRCACSRPGFLSVHDGALLCALWSGWDAMLEFVFFRLKEYHQVC